MPFDPAMFPRWYKLNEDGTVTPYESLEAMYSDKANPIEYLASRQIADTTIADRYRVSTVFLSLDHGRPYLHDSEETPYQPVLFETMIFETELTTKPWPFTKEGEKPRDWTFHKDVFDFQERYTTIELARAGHERVVSMVRASIDIEQALCIPETEREEIE